MHNPILQTLNSMGISYQLHHHEAVFTVAEASKIENQIPAFHTKNLFLKDKTGGHHLVCISAHQRLSIKEFGRTYGLKELSFGSNDDLYSQLHTTPGSVSILGMIYQSNTKLYLDPAIIDQPAIGRHPNDNTRTIVVSYAQITKLFDILHLRPTIIHHKLLIS